MSAGYLVLDGDLASIGPEAERKFGRRYFSDLTAVFSAAPQFTVLAGNAEIGTVGDDLLLSEEVTGPRVLLLAGRSWLVTSVDWKRRRCQVEPTDLTGRARWSSQGAGLSFAITRGVRDVLRGKDPANVTLTRRASVALAELRDDHAGHTADATVIHGSASGETLWWTWAGTAANRALHASLPDVVDERQRIGDRSLRLRPNLSTAELKRTLSTDVSLELPQVDDNALTGLKFSTALPQELARRTVAERLVDNDGAAQVLREWRRFVREG